MVIVLGLLRWAAALVIGIAAAVVVGVLRLDVPFAVVLAFAAGCLAGYVSTPGNTALADMISLCWLGGGGGLGFAIANMALGVPIAYFTGGWVAWMLGAMLVGWLVVAVPRTAEPDSFFGRLVGRWRRRR